ncbi:MAG: hypothetical protein ABI679_01510 [Gemmatimonadota bacterium]
MLAKILGFLVLVPVLHAQDGPAKPDIHVSGTILTNGFYTSASVNNSDVPTFVTPSASSGFPAHSLGGTIRQTQVRVTGTLAGIAGGDLHAELETDFFGGQQPSGGGRTHPLLRVRRAFFEMTWPSVSLLIGQEAPPIVGVNPSSVASLGFPEFASAGNLWLWLPQVRVTGRLTRGTGARFAVEGALLVPNEGTPQDAFTTQPDLAERSGRPNIEGRILAQWGGDDTFGELSVGGHLGWLATNGDSLIDSKAVAVSVRAPLLRWLEVRGEVFTGQALAGLGGGGIGQNLGVNGVPVETTGGWAQIILRRGARWEAGVGMGLDDPKNADVDSLTGRQKNTVSAVHLIWRPSPLLFGLEYRHLETTYGTGPLGGARQANHVNLAAGFEF